MPNREGSAYKKKRNCRKGRINIPIAEKDRGLLSKKHQGKITKKAICTKAEKAAERSDRRKVSEAVEEWISMKAKTLKPSSIAKYRNLAKCHILPLLGERRLCELNTATVGAFVQSLSEEKRGNGVPLHRSTVRNVLMILEKAVKLAGGQKIDVGNEEPIGKKDEKRRVTVLSDTEQLKLEQYLLTDTDERKLGLLLYLYAGLRIGEICALRWNCIDLSEKALSVMSTMQRIQITDASDGRRTEVIETAPKSDGSRRIIPIADFIVDLLYEKQPFSRDAFLLTGSERYIEPRSYENYYKRVLAAAGIAVGNFHILRHTFATRCIESGADVKTVSDLLGHSTVKLTLDRYVHPTMNTKLNSINRLAFSRQNRWQVSEYEPGEGA